MKIIVASQNPVKIQVAQNAFSKVFPDIALEVIGVKSDSGVPDQPMNDETRIGAHNRLDFIVQNYGDADYYISQEGGLYTEGDRIYNRAWIVVSDGKGNTGESSTSNYYLPQKVAELIQSGKNLSEAGDIFWGTENLGQHKGVVGMVTHGHIDRAEYYSHAAIIALCQTLDKDWYK